MDGIRKPLPSVGSPIAGIHNLRPEQELHKHAEHPEDYDQFPSALTHKNIVFSCPSIRLNMYPRT
jgi:hypothetical protein